MGDPRGFLKLDRHKAKSRPVEERLGDWAEVDLSHDEGELRAQASRCMDCGIPFCHQGCPLGNLIPDWNDAVYRGEGGAAREALLATNNFPEVTGRVCPAPCEAACVLNIEGEPVTIKDVERAIADSGDDIYAPRPAPVRRDARVAVVGSGPAGLAAAQELARLGYEVTVFERDDRPGGLLRYGIPDFKLEKGVLDRRLLQLSAEGVRFETGVDVGRSPTGSELLRDYAAVVLAVGARRPRELPVPGRELSGVHLAMDFLTQQNRRVAGLPVSAQPISAQGKRVVILGGGDTGSDCLGTSLRQGATGVVSLELMPRPPDARAPHNPWPEWPLVMRTSSSHEEGGERDYAIMTKALLGDPRTGAVRALKAVRVALEGGKLVELPKSELEIPCELVLLAMGFVGPEPELIEQLGLSRDGRGNVVSRGGETSVARVFAAGDVSRGASLVVWAIAEGRRAAARVHAYLEKRATSAA